MKGFVFAAAIAILASGCATAPGMRPVIHVQPGRQFDLAVGQEAQVEGTAVNVRFSGVVQDSRCACNVQCVWEGNAVVRLTLSSSAATPSESALNTSLEPKQTPYAGYIIRLLGLKPHPTGKPILQTQYVATLEVSN